MIFKSHLCFRISACFVDELLLFLFRNAQDLPEIQNRVIFTFLEADEDLIYADLVDLQDLLQVEDWTKVEMNFSTLHPKQIG